MSTPSGPQVSILDLAGAQAVPYEETLNWWIHNVTPCPRCGRPNAPERSLDSISGSVVHKGRTCWDCFLVDACRIRCKGHVNRARRALGLRELRLT